MSSSQDEEEEIPCNYRSEEAPEDESKPAVEQGLDHARKKIRRYPPGYYDEIVWNLPDKDVYHGPQVNWNTLSGRKWVGEPLLKYLPHPEVNTLVAWAHYGTHNGTRGNDREGQPSQSRKGEPANPLLGVEPDGPLPLSHLDYLQEISRDLVRGQRRNRNISQCKVRNESLACVLGRFDASASVALGMVLEEMITANLLPLAELHVRQCRNLEEEEAREEALRAAKDALPSNHENRSSHEWTLPPEEAVFNVMATALKEAIESGKDSAGTVVEKGGDGVPPAALGVDKDAANVPRRRRNDGLGLSPGTAGGAEKESGAPTRVHGIDEEEAGPSDQPKADEVGVSGPPVDPAYGTTAASDPPGDPGAEKGRSDVSPPIPKIDKDNSADPPFTPEADKDRAVVLRTNMDGAVAPQALDSNGDKAVEPHAGPGDDTSKAVAPPDDYRTSHRFLEYGRGCLLSACPPTRSLVPSAEEDDCDYEECGDQAKHAATKFCERQGLLSRYVRKNMDVYQWLLPIAPPETGDHKPKKRRKYRKRSKP